MIITLNTDHNMQADKAFTTSLKATLLEKLEKYSHKIRKIEVHLTDENGRKKGEDDKRCLLEAHIDQMESTVSINHADTYEKSLAGAINNLKASLDKRLGRMKDRTV